MAKKIDGYIKLQIAAGQANPSPPVGPALGQKGVNIMEFCKAFNAATQKLEAGMPIPVTITVFQDKSFIFDIKNKHTKTLIKGIVEIGKSIGYSVLAEGIETKSDLLLAKKLGVEFGQGWFIGKPEVL